VLGEIIPLYSPAYWIKSALAWQDVFQKSIILPIFRDMSRAREEAAQASRFLTGAACWKAIRCISQFVPLADE
jgi:hypothetical protein